MMPPMGKHEARLKIRYVRKPVSGIYQAGELASWPADEARRLVASGIAEPVDWSPPGLKPEPDAA